MLLGSLLGPWGSLLVSWGSLWGFPGDPFGFLLVSPLGVSFGISLGVSLGVIFGEAFWRTSHAVCWFLESKNYDFLVFRRNNITLRGVSTSLAKMAFTLRGELEGPVADDTVFARVIFENVRTSHVLTRF